MKCTPHKQRLSLLGLFIGGRDGTPLKIQRSDLQTLVLRRLIQGIGIFVLALLPQRLLAATVTNTNDSGPGSLRQAIANAAPGETIDFAGSVSGTITLTTGQLTIDKNLTIQGPGANRLTVSGNNSTRVFIVASGTPSITLSGLTIAHGRVTDGAGGAIFDSGTGLLTISKCVVSGNAAFSEAGIHKGAVGGSSLTIVESTISGNTALSDVGGALGCSGVTGTITNCTISGNSALSRAGGIFQNSGSSLTITSCTISNNSITGAAGTGGGILQVSGASTRIRNTIIAGNSAQTASGQDVSGLFISEGYNLIGKGDGGTGFGQSTDQVGSNAAPLDARLAPLQNNGGTTQTHALATDSTAIDKGESFGATADQRGFTRPVDDPAVSNAAGGDGSDIGAFEATLGPQPPSQLLNIATRMRVQSGENVLIGGFIITGTESKNVIIRGIGPSLAQFFNGTLANPTLELFQGSTLLASNDDWKESQQAEIEATGIPPGNDFESAIVRTLPPGSYTATLRGKNDTTGIGVVETYDLNATANSKLANIATRGFVETGDNVMIGGLIVGPNGGASATVVVRAIGPSLSDFGVAGALQNPTLDLVNSAGVVLRSNNDWRDSQEGQIIATGLAPSDDRESALIETLAPGNYTAIVRGVGNTTGVGLVEAYHLQ
jgi:hypothetical protein